MANQYCWPATNALTGAPNHIAIANLEYGCTTCGIKAGCVEALKTHVQGKQHKKKTETAGSSEHPEIEANLEKYAALEEPHRAVSKAAKAAAWKTKVDSLKAEKEGKTPEELKALRDEYKRKRLEREEAEGPSKKKAKTGSSPSQPYICKCCNVELAGKSDFNAHMQGKAHMSKVAEFYGGCWLCGAHAPAQDAHFEGKNHCKKVASLLQFGIKPEMVGEMGFTHFGNAQGGAQGGGAAKVPKVAPTMTPALSAKAKGKGLIGARVTGLQGGCQAGLQGGCKGFKGKGKGGPGMNMMSMMKGNGKGNPDDPTCWNFINGKCNKGMMCNWVHALPQGMGMGMMY